MFKSYKNITVRLQRENYVLDKYLIKLFKNRFYFIIKHKNHFDDFDVVNY